MTLNSGRKLVTVTPLIGAVATGGVMTTPGGVVNDANSDHGPKAPLRNGRTRHWYLESFSSGIWI